MFKIGLDLQSISTRATGLGTYTRNLTGAMFGGVVNPAERKTIIKEAFSFHLYHQEKTCWRTPDRLFWENVTLPVAASKDKVDLLHIPAFSAPLWKPSKIVMTVHDIIGRLFPNQKGAVSRFYWGKWLPASIARADAVIADSNSTKNDLIKHLKIEKEKITVVYASGHEGFSHEISEEVRKNVRTKFNLSEKYFLFVGTIEPRKNLWRAIKAFAEFKKEQICKNVRFQFVVVGSKDFAHGAFFRELSSDDALDMNDCVFTGHVTQEELNALYRDAEAFLYPSLYEGFGIPVLEAMASGTPVITSETSSIPEVAGEAAYLVDPESVPQIKAGMCQMAGDPSCRAEMIKKGFEQIKKFSWKKTAQQTMEVYEKVLR